MRFTHFVGRPPGRRQIKSVCSLAVLAIILAGVPAAAALRIVSESPRARLFRGIYDQLPPCWKSSRPVVVREVSDAEMDMLVVDDDERRDSADDSVVDGYYQPARGDELPTITLRRTMRNAAAELVFAHEYAHFIWDNYLDDRQRGDYRRIWSRQEAAGKLVTEYAADCPEEGFSEAVSHFLLRQSVLKRRDDFSFRFVQSVIDSGMKRYRQSIPPPLPGP